MSKQTIASETDIPYIVHSYTQQFYSIIAALIIVLIKGKAD